MNETFATGGDGPAVGPNLVGTSVASRYDVLELLGRGGMGAVYRVLDRELDEIVALKVIRADLAGEHDMIERFRAEVRLARRVTHANVARTFEIGRADGIVFCTMELVEGESLAMHLRRRGALPLAEAATIATAVCDALHAAHAAGVIHRDIKPENILIASTGRIVVTDFGIAAITVGDARAEGTPAYMAPEQILGEPPTPAVDVYALGLVLYEMLTGQHAFSGDVHAIFTAKRTLEHVATAAALGEITDVIARATAREVAARIPTPSALRRELVRWAHAAPHAVATHERTLPQHAKIVVAPPRGDGDRRFVVDAIHGELLQRLARTPWIRVETLAPDAAATLELVASESEVAISIVRPHVPAFTLRAPLAVEHIAPVAESAAAALVAALAPRPAESLPALELVLRARHGAQTRVGRLATSVELLEEAARLAPDSALVAATLATAKLQRAFFAHRDDRDSIDAAARLVRIALERGPELFETHMAAGHLELHRGDPALAAAHFRAAIARAPHSAEAHDQLGRMLTEAGHIDRGFARLAEAIALAPDRLTSRWEIARARALDGDWSEHDELIASSSGGVDTLARLRFITWRGPEYARNLRHIRLPDNLFEPDVLPAIFAVICDGAWAAHRDRLVSIALDSQRPSLRRRAFVAQLVAETAGIGGDADACETLIAYAIDHGLFDLHWLDACDPIALVRARPRFRELREIVARRSVAILDALYGDVPGALDATVLV